MRKLTLDAEALTVETFALADAAAAEGTVHARSAAVRDDGGGSGGGPSCDDSCLQSCYFDTCYEGCTGIVTWCPATE